MTTDGLLSITLAVFIPFLLAVAGGILAVRALPSKASRIEKYWWIATFVFLFLIGMVLSFWQQVRVTTHDQAIAQKEKEKDIRTEGEVRYTQGQLDSINKMLANVVNSNVLNSSTAIKALLQGAATGRTKQCRNPGPRNPENDTPAIAQYGY